MHRPPVSNPHIRDYVLQQPDSQPDNLQGAVKLLQSQAEEAAQARDALAGERDDIAADRNALAARLEAAAAAQQSLRRQLDTAWQDAANKAARAADLECLLQVQNCSVLHILYSARIAHEERAHLLAFVPEPHKAEELQHASCWSPAIQVMMIIAYTLGFCRNDRSKGESALFLALQQQGGAAGGPSSIFWCQ